MKFRENTMNKYLVILNKKSLKRMQVCFFLHKKGINSFSIYVMLKWSMRIG